MKTNLLKVLMIVSKQIIYIFCIQLISLQLLLADSLKGQKLEEIKVSVHVKDYLLEDVFKLLESKTGFKYGYQSTEGVHSEFITLSMQADLRSVLEEIARQADVRFKRINNVISAVKVSEKQQKIILVSEEVIISGKVVDDKTGEPVIGASVILQENTSVGTITDINGGFSIPIPDAGATLLCSFIGYETVTLRVSGSQEVVIKMKEDVQLLEDVVVVGYGVQEKSDITGSVGSVSQKRLEMVPNLNIAQALQGSVPGLLVQQTGAGAVPNQTLMIRGRNSILADNSPLIVVDGIPYYGNITDLNVNDIQSMEVLKDASAAAIYGSRGSNGVILVTTKTGKTGKPQINFEARYSTQSSVNEPDFLTGAEFYEYKMLRDPSMITDTETQNYEAGITTDWVDLTLRNGQSELYDLSVSGGTDRVNYYVGGNYLEVVGLSITDQYKRLSGRANLDVKVTDWLTVGTRTQFTYDDKSGYNIDYGEVYQMNPLIGDPYTEDGEVNLYPWPEWPDANPLEAVNYQDKDFSYQIVTNNFINVDIPFIDGLSYRLNTGIRRKWADQRLYAGSNTTVGIANNGYANLIEDDYQNNVFENIVTYKKDFNRHSIFLTGVYSYEENQRYQQDLEAVDFPNDEFIYYGISQASNVIGNNDYSRTALISQMLRANYIFNDKYMVTFTGRRDGYSGFGVSNKWGIFPSVALGWNISDENFMAGADFFEYLKVRASWGKNGNQAVNPYASITRMSDRNTLSGDNSMVGYIPSVIGDENLGWESSETINLGLDFGLFEGRIQGDLNFYQTNTSDLLLNRTISSIHGVNRITQNIGETETKGIELGLQGTVVKTNQFTWYVNGNLATNKNKIVSLYGELDENGNEIDDLANSWFVGQPIRVNYGYRIIGVWQLDEAEEAAEWDSEPGFIKLEDVNGDGQMDADDRQIIGQQDPKFTWGLSNSFSYQNFTLEVFFHGVHGATRRNNLMRENVGAEIRRNVMRKNWWTEDNPTNDYPRVHIDAFAMGGAGGTIYESASFIRLKDISLAYTFPSPILEKLKLQKLQLYTTGRNLLTFTDWSGNDPELDLNGEPGIVPLQREFTFGVKLGL